MSSSKNPQIYIGGLSRRTRESDLEKYFDRYGKIRNLSYKSRYAFIVRHLSKSKHEFRSMMTTTLPGTPSIRWTEEL